MTDLVIAEADGWYELDDFMNAVRDGAVDVRALWDQVAEGDHEGALELLEQAGYDDLPEPGRGLVKVLMQPDAMLGELWRVWTSDVAGDEDDSQR